MELIFATHNKNKFTEVHQQLPNHIKLKSLTDLDYHQEIPEPYDTLEENAAEKTRTIFNNFNTPCFSDDTGLFVQSLGGAPGVYSARYAGPMANADKNIQKLLNALQDNLERDAYFKTVIALQTAKECLFFEGIVRGKIATTVSGTGGFGYDPIFIPEGYQETFAQLSASIKQKIGHRGKAMEALLTYLKK